VQIEKEQIPWKIKSTVAGVASDGFSCLSDTLLHICLATPTMDCLPSSSDNKNTSVCGEPLSEIRRINHISIMWQFVND